MTTRQLLNCESGRLQKKNIIKMKSILSTTRKFPEEPKDDDISDGGHPKRRSRVVTFFEKVTKRLYNKTGGGMFRNVTHIPLTGGRKLTRSSTTRKKLPKKLARTRAHSHITIITSNKGKTVMYRCKKCEKEFKTKAHTKYHEFCKSNRKRPFLCEQCGQGFIAKSHFQYHVRVHTGYRPHKCTVENCGKGFIQKAKLTRHMLSHTGEKPFACEHEQCGKSYANAQGLKEHSFTHTGECPYQCKSCNTCFNSKSNLIRHVIRRHTKKRPFKCTQCEKSFKENWNLTQHLKSHSTVRPYNCKECTREFIYKRDLDRHELIHSGVKPFMCSICGRSFRRNDNLKRHTKNIH